MEKIKPQETDDCVEVSQDDMVLLRNKLSDIKTACEKLMLKDAKTVLSELKKKTWPHKTSDIINEISLCLIRGEYAKIGAIVDKAMDEIKDKKSTTSP